MVFVRFGVRGVRAKKKWGAAASGPLATCLRLWSTDTFLWTLMGIYAFLCNYSRNSRRQFP